MKAYCHRVRVLPWFQTTLVGLLVPFTLASAPGDLDRTFQVRGLPSDPLVPAIRALVIQQDDQILLGGSFAQIDGRAARGLVRLQANGSVDLTYSPNLNLRNANGDLRVTSMVLLPGGRVVFDASGLTDINGANPRGAKDWAPARLLGDGTLDNTFVPGGHFSSGTPLAAEVRVLAAYARGEILVQADGLRRLTPQGPVDGNWPQAGGDPVIPGFFLCAGVQRDGSAVVYGQFDVAGSGEPHRDRLYRLRADGNLDTQFEPWQPLVASGTYGGGQAPVIRQVLVLPDDKLLVIGTFSWLRQGGKTYARGSVARLNADGSMDESFLSAMGLTDVYAYSEIPQWNSTNSRSAFVAALAPDGRVLVGGHFNGYGGVLRPNLLRLNVDGTLDFTFTPRPPDHWITQLGVQSNGGVIISSATVVGAGGLPPYYGGASLVRLEGGPLTSGPPLIVRHPEGQSVQVPSNQETIQFYVTVLSVLPLSFQWFHNGTPLADGPGVSGAQTRILTLTNLSQLLAGNYECEVANTGGRVLSEPALLVINQSASPMPDRANPILTIASPEQATLRTLTSRIAFYGTASDNIGLGRVQMRRDDEVGWTTVRGLREWNVFSNLDPGSNHFQFRAVDLAGNSSETSTRTVVFVAMKGFALSINGEGNVSRPTFGASLEAGRTYTLQATPKPGNVFSNWIVNGQSYSDSTFRFVLTNDTEVIANFVPNPFPALAGNYLALFFDPSAPGHLDAGALNFKVTSQGAVVGKGLQAGKPFTFASRLDLSLVAHATWPNQDGTASLQLELSANQDGLSGNARLPGRIIPVNGYRARPFLVAPGVPPSASQRFTTVLSQPEPNLPEMLGRGYATLTLERGTKLRLQGSLGDGTAWAISCGVSAHGDFPVYLPLAGGQGSIFGWVKLAGTSTNDVDGTLFWTRPGMFTHRVYLAGSRYDAPRPGAPWLDGQQTVLIRQGGPLAEAITNSIALNEKLEMLIGEPNADHLTLAYKRSTGEITGRFLNPSGTLTALRGVMLQKQGAGGGNIRGVTRAGSFFLGPIANYPAVP